MPVSRPLLLFPAVLLSVSACVGDAPSGGTQPASTAGATGGAAGKGGGAQAGGATAGGSGAGGAAPGNSGTGGAANAGTGGKAGGGNTSGGAGGNTSGGAGGNTSGGAGGNTSGGAGGNTSGGAGGSTSGGAGGSTSGGAGGSTSGGAGGSTSGGAGGNTSGGAGGNTSGGAGAGGAACEVTSGDGSVASNVKLAEGGSEFVDPLDAAPSPDGKTIYFTASTLAGDAGVFSVKDDGSALTTLASGGKMVSPTSIAVSADGQTLYIADPDAAEDPSSLDPKKDSGLFFSLPVAGGTPTVLVAGKSPGAVAVGTSGTNCTEVVFFCGVEAGVTSVFDKTGNAALSGTELTDCSGLSIGTDGTIFIVAASSTTRRGAVISGKPGATPATLVDGLAVGYPSGIALSPDGTDLVVSGLSRATRNDVLLKIKLADKSVTEQAPLTAPLVEAGGLHRALRANVYSFVDGLGGNGKGSVWLVKP